MSAHGFGKRPQRSARPASLRGWLLCLVLICATPACTHPCDTLEERVCESEPDESKCELIQDPERRELLTRATCSGILDVMDKRR